VPLLGQSCPQLIKVLVGAAVKKVKALILRDLRDHREFAAVPRVPLHAPFNSEKEFWLDFAYNFVS
jgi:hypothetical protein